MDFYKVLPINCYYIIWMRINVKHYNGRTFWNIYLLIYIWHAFHLTIINYRIFLHYMTMNMMTVTLDKIRDTCDTFTVCNGTLLHFQTIHLFLVNIGLWFPNAGITTIIQQPCMLREVEELLIISYTKSNKTPSLHQCLRNLSIPRFLPWYLCAITMLCLPMTITPMKRRVSWRHGS